MKQREREMMGPLTVQQARFDVVLTGQTAPQRMLFRLNQATSAFHSRRVNINPISGKLP